MFAIGFGVGFVAPLWTTVVRHHARAGWVINLAVAQFVIGRARVPIPAAEEKLRHYGG